MVVCVLSAIVSTMGLRDSAAAAPPPSAAGSPASSSRVIVKLRAAIAARAEAALPADLALADASSDPVVAGFLGRHQARRIDRKSVV